MIYKLEEICIMKSGGTPKRSNLLNYNGTIPWVTISDFKNAPSDILFHTQELITERGLKSINNRIFKKGTLLLAMYGSIGKTVITANEVSTNQAILGINPKDDKILNIKYLKYWFDSNKDFLYSQGQGATLNNISLTIVKRQEIDLPRIEIQDKIVAILDKIKHIIEKRQKTIGYFELLLKSNFINLFGDPLINPKGWKKISLNSACSKIVDCPHSTPDYTDVITEFPCIRTSEIRNGEIFWDSMKYLSEEAYKNRASRLIPTEQDIVFAREGTVGDAAIIPQNLKISLGQRVMLFRVDTTKVTSNFLWSFLRSDGCQSLIKSITIGATVQRVNIKDLKKIQCIIPPLELQYQFDEISQSIKKAKLKLVQTQIQFENLLNSLSQLAFKGKLNFNTAVDLEVLMENDYEFFKTNSNSEAIKLLLEKLDKNELNANRFHEHDLYNKAKGFVFELLKEGKVRQIYDSKSNRVKLTV